MAFGKDTTKLETIGSFRQVGSTYTAVKREPRGKGGGGNVPYFINAYKPSKHTTDTIRLIAGAYQPDEVDSSGNLVKSTNILPFWPYTEHYDGRSEKSCICSAGPRGMTKASRLPCRGCDIYWEAYAAKAEGEKQTVKRMSKREMFAFTIIDYANYHRVPQVDASGAPRCSQDGTQYYNTVKCTGRGCKNCAAGCETKTGNRMHWSLGSMHFNTLLEYDNLIGMSCCTCGKKDCITTIAWLCSNPECGEAVIDMSSTSLNDKEIAEQSQKVVRCPACKTDGYLKPVIECANCTPAGMEPRQATIFDVDLKVKRMEPADGSNATTLIISSWSEPHPVAPPFDGLAQNLDLAKIFTPTSMEQQVKLFDGGNIRQPVSTEARPYNR